MAKYAIKKEFFPFNHFKPPINKAFLGLARVFMRTPRCVRKDEQLDVKRYKIKSYDGAKIKCLLLSPKGVGKKAPCLIYFHGGGFVLPAAKYHYKNAMHYAKEAGCKVWFVNYRLAPKHPHPTFFEDCYAATRYVYENAAALGIDKENIGIGGDSAGATLSVGTAIMVRDHNYPIRFAFQMLIYPFLDMRGTSEANQKYTDTPMWNSSLSTKIDSMTKVDRNNPLYIYYSPVEAETFQWLPPAYIETAEFDCLHDDGILYAELLRKEGIPVEVNETRGTMHGFDIKQKAPTTKEALASRVAFMRKIFNKN
jgi:acetyl esterase/lipase